MNTIDKRYIEKVVKEEISKYMEDHPMCKAGTTWSNEEKETLLNRFEEFVTATSKLHGRSQRAIKMQLVALTDDDLNPISQGEFL